MGIKDLLWGEARLSDVAFEPRREQRASIEDPQVPISSENVMAFLGLESLSSAGETVTVDSALGVPAIWAAVNFLSGTLATLPVHMYRRRGDDRVRVRGAIPSLLNEAANDETSGFDWRKYVFDCVFTQGRSITFIERTKAGSPMNLWPLQMKHITVERRNGRKRYKYQEDDNRAVIYDAQDVIDIPFMLKPDGLSHRGPISTNVEVIALAQAATKYGARFFSGGGVPPFAIEGNFQSPGAMRRAADQLATAVQEASRENRLALSLPMGHTIKSLGTDPEKSQLVELQRFIVEQIARIYSLPPTFLQDLTHGTFSNTEQQDLHFVKHTLSRWVTQVERELNLKLFGRKSNARFVEFNVDGLLRGDFKTRMDGLAQAVQNALMKPNEARQRLNLSDDPEGDRLFIQGATVPIAQAGMQETPSAQVNSEGDDD